MAGELSIEDSSPVRAKGLDEDVLDGLVVLVAGIELAAALRLAEMDPVRSAVASGWSVAQIVDGRFLRKVVNPKPRAFAGCHLDVSRHPDFHGREHSSVAVDLEGRGEHDCPLGSGPLSARDGQFASVAVLGGEAPAFEGFPVEREAVCRGCP